MSTVSSEQLLRPKKQQDNHPDMDHVHYETSWTGIWIMDSTYRQRKHIGRKCTSKGKSRGLERTAGGLNGLSSSVMIDRGEFDGAKAYKDSKAGKVWEVSEKLVGLA